MVKILGFLKSQSGCDWYRCEQPLLHIRSEKAAEVKLFHANETISWFGSQEKVNEIDHNLQWADILFVPRLSEGKLCEVLKEFRSMGKKVVTDWDDDIFNVSPFSQQYYDFGQEEFSYKTEDGQVIEIWKDKKNFDLDRNREIRRAQIEGIRFSDAMIVTTPELGKVYSEYQKNIRICNNAVNTKFWNKLPLIPHEGIRLGWFGGDSHYEDWLVIAPVVKSFMNNHPEATLVIMGKKFDGTVKGINPAQIEHHPWTHILAYPYKASSLDLDFGIIPLKDTLFNRGKSAVKWMEMAALEVPCITSFVQPYSKMMDIVKDNGIFIEENDPRAWYEGMETMSKDRDLRLRMGKAARKTVVDNFDANNNWKDWFKVFEEVHSWPLQVPQP